MLKKRALPFLDFSKVLFSGYSGKGQPENIDSYKDVVTTIKLATVTPKE